MGDEPATGANAAPAGKSKLMPIIIVAALMIGEGVGIYFVAKALHTGPDIAAAGQGVEEPEPEGVVGMELSEVALGEARPSNKMSGKFITFQVKVSILVDTERLEATTALVETKQARLKDRINFVFRSAELNHLNEPGLETIRRRLKFEFDRVFVDDTIVKEVLITEMLQSSSGV